VPDPEAIAELRRRFGAALRTEEGETERFRRDASGLEELPAAVVAPADPEAVEWLVRWARVRRVGLVARGGGTSLDGESVPSRGGVVVDLSGWNSVLEVDPVDRVARVGPGLVNRELQEALRPHGLFFPPNPGSWTSSTIGGNAATNASGPRSFRYGPTRHWIRSAEVVLGTGEPIRVGSRAAKRSIGPDLLEMLLGSEGTLGIFTELTVALAPRPARRAALGVALPEEVSPAAVAAGLSRETTHGVSAVEYLDATCAAALAATPGARLPGDRPLVLLEVESADEEEETRRLEYLHARLRALGIVDDPLVFPDADELWTLRGASGTALDRSVGPRLREDVAVPVSRLDDFLRAMRQLARDADARFCVYGHLGEGSLHPNFAVAGDDVALEHLRRRILDAAVRLGGTISGEHGIGLRKVGALGELLGPPGVRTLRGVKAVFDPDGILNPGKLYPPEPPVAEAVRPP
jgi:D-lactate dehydrogenase